MQKSSLKSNRVENKVPTRYEANITYFNIWWEYCNICLMQFISFFLYFVLIVIALYLSNENHNIYSQMFLLGGSHPFKYQMNLYNLLFFPLLPINSMCSALDISIWMYQMLTFFWMITSQKLDQRVLLCSYIYHRPMSRESTSLKTTWNWSNNNLAWKPSSVTDWLLEFSHSFFYLEFLVCFQCKWEFYF